MHLNPPDLHSRRARLADWLELLVLTSASGQVSLSVIVSQLRRVSDDRTAPTDFDADADDLGEPEVTDRAADDLDERLYEEISFRVANVGSAYPFDLVSDGMLGKSQVLRRRHTWKSLESGELVYVFCVLDSGIRDGLVTVEKNERYLVQQIGHIFQICSCIAVGGYMNAEVVSFGFPRAVGDGFLPALQAAWKRYGSYLVRPDIPHGFDAKLKDGGIDIIAWRHFADRHAATFLMFVQVASGLDWKDKPVANDVKSIRQWFVNERFEHFLPAICIPFPLWFDLDEPARNAGGHKLAFKEGIVRRFAVRESTFGIIFDRGRIAQSCAIVLRASEMNISRIDGLERVNEVLAWVDTVTLLLAEVRAAA